MTLAKTHPTDSIHKGLGMPESRSFELVGALLENMKATLANGEDILRGLCEKPDFLHGRQRFTFEKSIK